MVTDKNMSTPLLTASQVAEILQLSSSKVYRMIQQNEIPTVRMGRAVRVLRDDLENFILGNRTRNEAEPEWIQKPINKYKEN